MPTSLWWGFRIRQVSPKYVVISNCISRKHNYAVTLRRGPVCSCGFRISAAGEQAGRCGPAGMTPFV